MQNFQKDNKGFSLIEVMVAMVLLALISIPLMNNFATSAKLNASSRQIQDANTIGQKAMEQVKSVSVEDTYKKFNALGNSNLMVLNETNGEIAKDTAYLGNSNKYTFRETGIPGDVGNYNVEVTVDATPYDYVPDPAGNPTAGPNRVPIPNLTQINGGDNVVFSETDLALGFALDELWMIHHNACQQNPLVTEKSRDEIKGILHKNMILYLQDPDPLDNKVTVGLRYEYYINSENKNNPIYGLDKNVPSIQEIGEWAVEDISNIYVFYNVFDLERDGFRIESGIPDGKISAQLYLIAQEPVPLETSGYQLVMKDKVPNCINNIRMNAKIQAFPSDSFSGFHYNELVMESTSQKRLYEVVVKVYKGTAVLPYSTNDLLAEFRSTKGE